LAINLDYQRAASKKIGSTVTEVEGGSHTTMVSHPDVVAKAILEAISAGS
jgi:pimeloyl-ACP methyl ester carboxylesterase